MGDTKKTRFSPGPLDHSATDGNDGDPGEKAIAATRKAIAAMPLGGNFPASFFAVRSSNSPTAEIEKDTDR